MDGIHPRLFFLSFLFYYCCIYAELQQLLPAVHCSMVFLSTSLENLQPRIPPAVLFFSFPLPNRLNANAMICITQNKSLPSFRILHSVDLMV